VDSVPTGKEDPPVEEVRMGDEPPASPSHADDEDPPLEKGDHDHGK
jgi:hypothetical protein